MCDENGKILVTEKDANYVYYIQINAQDDAFFEVNQASQLEQALGELHYFDGIVPDPEDEGNVTITYNGYIYNIENYVINPLPEVLE